MDNFSDNVDVSESEFIRVVLEFFTFAYTKDNTFMTMDLYCL